MRAAMPSTPTTPPTASRRSDRPPSLTTWVGAPVVAAENPHPTLSCKPRRTWMKEKAPVVKQLYRLSIEPRVVEQLAKLAERLREPRSRLASRLFTEAVMGAKLPRR